MPLVCGKQTRGRAQNEAWHSRKCPECQLLKTEARQPSRKLQGKGTNQNGKKNRSNKEKEEYLQPDPVSALRERETQKQVVLVSKV